MVGKPAPRHQHLGNLYDSRPRRAPSPCSEWTVRQVAEHVVEVPGMAGRQPEPGPGAPAGAFAHVRDVVAAGEVARIAGFVAQMPAEVRASGRVSGPALEPPAGADDQTRMLASTGRKAW